MYLVSMDLPMLKSSLEELLGDSRLEISSDVLSLPVARHACSGVHPPPPPFFSYTKDNTRILQQLILLSSLAPSALQIHFFKTTSFAP